MPPPHPFTPQNRNESAASKLALCSKVYPMLSKRLRKPFLSPLNQQPVNTPTFCCVERPAARRCLISTVFSVEVCTCDCAACHKRCTDLSCVVFIITAPLPPPIRPFNFGKLRWRRVTDCFLWFSSSVVFPFFPLFLRGRDRLLSVRSDRAHSYTDLFPPESELQSSLHSSQLSRLGSHADGDRQWMHLPDFDRFLCCGAHTAVCIKMAHYFTT